MLKCRDFVRNSDALLEGELSWTGRLSAYIHLLICHHCRRYFRQFRVLLKSIPAMHGRASKQEVERVMQKIEKS